MLEAFISFEIETNNSKNKKAFYTYDSFIYIINYIFFTLLTIIDFLFK